MILDLHTLGNESLEADVCVLGAGAAGITVARQLAGTHASVVLLEGGGLEPKPEVQALYAGENVGSFYSLEGSRLRYFGGSTNHWEGWCGPLDESDFRVREWIPHSGWPIDREELLPYWERGHEILELGPFEYELPTSVQPTTFKALRTRFWRHSPPTRFNEKYREEIRRSDRITCLIHANVLRIYGAGAGRAVQRIAVGTLDGTSAFVRARWFVLACGGIENARLLLLASQREDLALDRVASNTGRFFMDHVFAPTATVVAKGDWWQQFERFDRQGFELTPGIGVEEAAQREHAMLNLAGMIRRSDCPPGLLPGQDCFAFLSVGEQAPNPDSRITLSSQTDALGLPVTRLDWRLTEIDRHTIATGALLLARELGRLGLGRIKLEPVTQPSIFPRGLWAANHHMGTTRMGDDGVVDRDCRVHGIENLFVAGSSVFPTSGCMNPTLTIVALALRLADHLARNL